MSYTTPRDAILPMTGRPVKAGRQAGMVLSCHFVVDRRAAAHLSPRTSPESCQLVADSG
jgi:hypothetical protein